ncbi:hypothetical protein ACS0TY_005673 [Phlomoides rotata]
MPLICTKKPPIPLNFLNHGTELQQSIKLANCYLKLDSKHEAASAYVDSANCCKKISPKRMCCVEGLWMLNVLIYFLHIGE